MAQNTQKPTFSIGHVLRRERILSGDAFALPILRDWRTWRQGLPSTLALHSLWHALFSERQSNHQYFLETWIRDVGTCHCASLSLRRFLLPKEIRTTQPFLPVFPEARSWNELLQESWQIGVPPWEIAPEHPIIKHWEIALRAGSEGKRDNL